METQHIDALPKLRDILDMMLAELKQSRLLVILCPAPRQMHSGHCVRYVLERNPAWYRKRYWNQLRRYRFERYIERMIAGNIPNSYYVETILDIALEIYFTQFVVEDRAMQRCNPSAATTQTPNQEATTEGLKAA